LRLQPTFDLRVLLSAYPELTRLVFGTSSADPKNDLAVRTIRFFLDIAIVTVMHFRLIAHSLKAVKVFRCTGLFLEPFLAGRAYGIDAGLALIFQVPAAPVQVGHGGILSLTPYPLKMIGERELFPGGFLPSE
jgi:hypothetical protein